MSWNKCNNKSAGRMMSSHLRTSIWPASATNRPQAIENTQFNVKSQGERRDGDKDMKGKRKVRKWIKGEDIKQIILLSVQ
jgi:hypothetical protein